MKRTVAFCLAFALLLGLTFLVPTRNSAANSSLGAAYSTQSGSPPDQLFSEAYTNLSALDSMHMEMKMMLDMSVRISMSGQSMSLPVNITLVYSTDQQTVPYTMSGQMEMSLNFMGTSETHRMILYGEKLDSTITSFVSSDDGATWDVNRVEKAPASPSEFVALIVNNSQAYRTLGSETIQDRPVIVCTCLLDAQIFQQYMDTIDSGDVLSGLMGEGGSSMDMLQGSIGVTMFIDSETHLPLRFSMDMTEMMSGSLKAAMQSAMGLQEMEGMEVDVDIPAMIIDCDLSQFNSVPPIEIPEAARAAAAALDVPAAELTMGTGTEMGTYYG